MINWEEVQKAVFPIKTYEDVCQRLKTSYGFRFVQHAYNFSLPGLQSYTHKLLGEDPRGRYAIYNTRLVNIIDKLHQAGIEKLLDLKDRTATREHMELLADQSGLPGQEIATLLKYLVYWVIPSEKYLSGLVKSEPDLQTVILALRNVGIRTNLELLQAGLTPTGRKLLANKSGAPYMLISTLVNRADFSRLPWASKATISNIMGAGYASLKQLANANPEQLIADFFRYGKSIGKNLKLGNEIESSYRIAQIIPTVVHED